MNHLGKVYRKLLTVISYKLNPTGIPAVAKSKGVLFIHIPKAAGSSISLSLYGIQVGHIPAKKYYLSNRKEFSDIKSFSIVRDPIKRFTSAYYFLCSGGMTLGDKVNYDKYLSQYIDINDYVDSLTLDFVNSGTILHLLPQHHFLYYKSTCIVDYVYKLENLNSEKIENDLNISWDVGYKNRGKSSQPVALSDESIDKLKIIYQRDLYLFGYNL
jgi:hypothetical protein